MVISGLSSLCHDQDSGYDGYCPDKSLTSIGSFNVENLSSSAEESQYGNAAQVRTPNSEFLTFTFFHYLFYYSVSCKFITFRTGKPENCPTSECLRKGFLWKQLSCGVPFRHHTPQSTGIAYHHSKSNPEPHQISQN